MSRKAMTLTVTIPVPSAAGVAGWLRGLPRVLGRGLIAWQERAMERAQFAAMDDRMRKDMGISYEDWLREINKPFWRP